jgi:hypothetical protein
MKTSETTKGLSEALAKSLQIITNPLKDTSNTFFKSKYATLDTGLVVIRDALSKNGISFTQTTRMDGDVLFLDTRIMHGDEWIEGEYPVAKFPSKPQEIGSAITYARRYSLFAICGVTGEDDDDGNAASSPTPAPSKKASSSDEQSQLIFDGLAASLGSTHHTPAELDAWVAKNLTTINKMLPEHKTKLREEIKMYKQDMNELEVAE